MPKAWWLGINGCSGVVRHAVLFLCVPGPLLVIGAHLPLIKAWGFRPTAMGFVLIKLRPLADPANFTLADLHTGTGFTTRKNAEYVVLCKRGKSLRRDAGAHEIIVTPRREHSRKPDELYHRIERYVGGEGPFLELFCKAIPTWLDNLGPGKDKIRSPGTSEMT